MSIFSPKKKQKQKKQTNLACQTLQKLKFKHLFSLDFLSYTSYHNPRPAKGYNPIWLKPSAPLPKKYNNSSHVKLKLVRFYFYKGTENGFYGPCPSLTLIRKKLHGLSSWLPCTSNIITWLIVMIFLGALSTVLKKVTLFIVMIFMVHIGQCWMVLGFPCDTF